MFSVLVISIFFALGTALPMPTYQMQQETTVTVPFYGLIHSNFNSTEGVPGAMQREIVRLNGLTEHYTQLKKNGKTSSIIEQMTLDKQFDFDRVNFIPVSDRKFTIECSLKPSFYDSLRMFRSNYNVTLGFVSPPALYSADVVISSENNLVSYYLKQISMNLHKEENDYKILQVDSVFLRRDLDVSSAAHENEGILFVKSVYNYTLETARGYIIFDLQGISSDSFFSNGTRELTEAEASAVKSTSNLFLYVIFALIY